MNAFLPSVVKISVAGLLLAIGAAHAQPTYSTVEQPSEFGAPQWPQSQVGATWTSARSSGQLTVRLGVQTGCAITLFQNTRQSDPHVAPKAALQCSDSVAWLANLIPLDSLTMAETTHSSPEFRTLKEARPGNEKVVLLIDENSASKKNLRLNLDY